MSDRKIYEINYLELKEIYSKYKENANLKINKEVEKTYKDSEFDNKENPFLMGSNNERYLMNYIKEIGEDIKRNFIANYINKDKSINQPFNKIDCKIFISHSHKDSKIVMGLAEKIYNDIDDNCFIDSKYWPYFNDVIEDCIQMMYENDKRGKLSLWDVSKTVRDIIDIYLLEALQIQLLNSNTIIIVKTENYSLNSHWIRYEKNVIDYICNKEKCTIQKVNVNQLLNQICIKKKN